MALTIYRGYTLTDGLNQNYNYTTLNALVASATVTSIPISALATVNHFVQVASSTPSSDQGTGSIWFDTTLGILRTKTPQSVWQTSYGALYLQNSSGVTIPKGAAIAYDPYGGASMAATYEWPRVTGILSATLTDGSSGVVFSRGLQRALVVGPATIGDVLVSAGHGTFAFADGYLASMQYPTVRPTITLGVSVGMCFGAVASGTTGLVTCMIWR